MSRISAVVRYGAKNKRKEHGCVDGWMNDRQDEVRQRRKGSQERCRGVIEQRQNGGCVARMRGEGMLDLLPYNSYSRDDEEQCMRTGKQPQSVWEHSGILNKMR